MLGEVILRKGSRLVQVIETWKDRDVWEARFGILQGWAFAGGGSRNRFPNNLVAVN